MVTYPSAVFADRLPLARRACYLSRIAFPSNAVPLQRYAPSPSPTLGDFLATAPARPSYHLCRRARAAGDSLPPAPALRALFDGMSSVPTRAGVSGRRGARAAYNTAARASVACWAFYRGSGPFCRNGCAWYATCTVVLPACQRTGVRFSHLRAHSADVSSSADAQPLWLRRTGAFVLPGTALFGRC